MVSEDFFVLRSCQAAREHQQAGIAALVDLARGTAPTVELPAVGIERSSQAARHSPVTIIPDPREPCGKGPRPPGLPPDGVPGSTLPGDLRSGCGGLRLGESRALAERRLSRVAGGQAPAYGRLAGGPAKVCVLVPTRNEAGNVAPLLARLRQLGALRLAVPARAGRLMRFAMVGGSGVVINLLVLAVLLRAGVGAVWAGGQIIAAIAATQAAIGWNFALTERWVFPGRPGHWARRLFPFWALNCGALLAQLPLAARLQWLLGGSYLLATAAALAILILARFAVCDRWLYRPAGRRRVTVQA